MVGGGEWGGGGGTRTIDVHKSFEINESFVKTKLRLIVFTVGLLTSTFSYFVPFTDAPCEGADHASDCALGGLLRLIVFYFISFALFIHTPY